MTNNKKAKIEFLLNNTPEILLDQFVNIVKLILYFNKATPSVRKNNEFINDAYNSINVIFKLICMISNRTDINKLQYNTPNQDKVQKERLQEHINNTANKFSNLCNNAESFSKSHEENVDQANFSKLVIERAVGKPAEDIEEMDYDSLSFNFTDINE